MGKSEPSYYGGLIYQTYVEIVHGSSLTKETSYLLDPYEIAFVGVFHENQVFRLAARRVNYLAIDSLVTLWSSRK